jgi:formate transporter
MAYIKPGQVLESMIQTGTRKSNQSIKHLLLGGALSGALLAFATTLAFTATTQTNLGIIGALVFPVGFVIIVLLGLDLVTGNFALIPVAVLGKKTSFWKMIVNFFWVTIGHLLGCLFYAVLYYIAVTDMGNAPIDKNAVVQLIIKTAETKTIGYEKFGIDGQITVFVKAMLCNWMVTLGAVMAMTSKSTGGKIVAMWLPIFTFFAQGFEHAVVNLFVIPSGIMFGANISITEWWLWNQFPVLLGNLTGGFLFTGLILFLIYKNDIGFVKKNTAVFKKDYAKEA